MATMAAATATTPTATAASSSSHSHYDVDERIAARNAVEITSEKWKSLVTEHASTFVAADRRSASIQEALLELLLKIDRETRPFVERVGRALDPDHAKKEGDDDEEGKQYDDDDDEDGGPIQSASVLLADLAEKHRLRRRMLVHHSSLLELLELPSLMDACVRSSLYDDALSIAGFANTLERRHLVEQSSLGVGRQQQQQDSTRTKGGDEKQIINEDSQQRYQQQKDGDVVSGVVFEIRRREADLRRMLIHRLRQDVTMPQCLEVVTALRRLNGVELERRNNINSVVGSVGGAADTISSDHDLEGVHAAMEMRLQVDFLEARDAWLEAGVTKIGSAQAAAVVAIAASSSSGDKGGPMGTSAQAEQILDGIERYRTRFFDIVTQFLAIFRGSLVPSAANNHDHSFSLLSMWTARRIQTFLTTLSSNLETHANDTATLRDALDAASFFASSMGRVGADFQPLLAPIFEPRLTEMIVGQWNDGLNGMVETLKACMDAGIAGPLVGTETSLSKDGSNGYENVDDGIEILQSTRTPAPPRKLLALPPLARFLNAYLGGLNELRRCLLPGAFPTIRSAYRKLITDAKMALQANERTALTPGLRGEAARLREVASKMKREFDECLEPHMNGCLEVALGSFDYVIAESKAAAIAEKQALAAAIKAKAEKEAAERAKAEVEEALEQAKQEAAAVVKSLAEASESTNEQGNVPPESSVDIDQNVDSTMEVL
ncbi:hypothetical protein ACHAXH_005176 [Discostella pseudostelligera]